MNCQRCVIMVGMVMAMLAAAVQSTPRRGTEVVVISPDSASAYVGGLPANCWFASTATCPANSPKCSEKKCDVTKEVPGDPNSLNVYTCPQGLVQAEQPQGSYDQAVQAPSGRQAKRSKPQIHCVRTYDCLYAGVSSSTIDTGDPAQPANPSNPCKKGRDGVGYCKPDLAQGPPTNSDPRTPTEPDALSPVCPVGP